MARSAFRQKAIFILGDVLALEDLDARSQPERVRAVEPFLLDRYEMSVGRYRDAVKRQASCRRELHSARAMAALDIASEKGGMCTWNAAPP